MTPRPEPFRSAPEILLAITEELGEVAQEVALIERIGAKAAWTKEPSSERLAEEIGHLLNCIHALADFYGLDVAGTPPGQNSAPSRERHGAEHAGLGHPP